MARLVADPSLEMLLVTIRELEARLVTLKGTANAVAENQGVAPPFPARPSPRVETPFGVDFESEFAADSQD